MKHSEWQKHDRSSCDIESDGANAKDVEDQTNQKQGLDEMQSTSLSSSSCPQSSSLTEQEDGDALVVEDSEEDEGDDGPVSVPKKRLKESVSRDPFPLRENLQLGLEEVCKCFL